VLCRKTGEQGVNIGLFVTRRNDHSDARKVVFIAIRWRRQGLEQPALTPGALDQQKNRKSKNDGGEQAHIDPICAFRSTFVRRSGGAPRRTNTACRFPARMRRCLAYSAGTL